MWMLCLLYAGINSEDDALIYIKNSVFEILLSVYTSPLSDIESKELILLVSCDYVLDVFCFIFPKAVVQVEVWNCSILLARG